jgi:hypothetical protein
MLNGQLLDESLLLMVEQLGRKDMNEMQKNFAAVETCAGIGIFYNNNFMLP